MMALAGVELETLVSEPDALTKYHIFLNDKKHDEHQRTIERKTFFHIKFFHAYRSCHQQRASNPVPYYSEFNALRLSYPKVLT